MMNRPRPRLALALSLVLAALSLASGDASAQRGARRPARPRPAAPKPPQEAPLRLVVQQGHDVFMHGFATFSADGRLVATGASGDVVVWDAATGREVRRLTGNEGDPGAQDIDGWLWGAFSPDARLLATSVGAFLRLWDVRTGRLVWQRQHAGHPFFRVDGARPPVSFSADGRQLVIAPDTGHRVTWDVASGRLVAHTRPRAEKEIYWSEKAPREAVAPGAKFGAKAAAGVVRVTDKASGKELSAVRFREGAESDEDGLLALAVSPDGRSLLIAERVGEDGHALRLWDAAAGAPRHELSGRQGELIEFRFTDAGGLVTVSEAGRSVRALDVVSGRTVVWEVEGKGGPDSLEVSPDGRLVVTTSGRVGQVWDAQTGAQLARVEAELPAGAKPEEFGWDFAGFTPDRTVTFFKDAPDGGEQTVRLDVEGWKAKRTGGLQTMPFRQQTDPSMRTFMLTRDARAAAWETDNLFEGEPDGSKWMTVWNADPQVKNKRFKIDSDEAYNDPSSYVLSPDGRKVLVATSNAGGSLPHNSVKVWDADQKRALFKLAAPGFRVGALAWSPDGRLLATGANDGTTVLWDAATGRQVRRLAGQRDNVYSLEFSPDSRHLLSLSADGFGRLFDTGSGAEVCRFITFAGGSWVVVAPDGRFDADDLEEVRGVHWVASDDPFRPLPLEIFMRDYYEPRLLARLLAGEKLKPVRALAEINRAQPRVEIKRVEQRRDRPELARVTVEVERGRPPEGAPPRPHNVYDLRLFRDGRLVAAAPARDGQLALDPVTETATVTFDDIRLPRAAAPEGVEFSAYAFNDDRVKSPTARARLRPDAPPAPSKGRAYVISVGVNAYQNEAWDLRFAANDARRVQELIAARVEAGGEYEETVRVALVSDYETKEGRKTSPRVLRETAATKENFKAVLDLLAGREVGADRVRAVPGAERLRAATPEDLVIVTFSSHGYADERGDFYLLTYDSGAGGEMAGALQRSISSDELSAWMRDVDAGEMVFVVDACHSAASVQGADFKPGPMGSRGLGQLAYDKGMRVLTSTQADDVALEFNLVEMGLLTYALTRDAVERAEADRAPKDRRITVSEWLAYAVERVPQLHAEVSEQLAAQREGKTSAPTLGPGTGTRVVRFGPAAPTPPAPGAGSDRGLTVVTNERNLQRPSLFDFRRRRRDPVLVRN